MVKEAETHVSMARCRVLSSFTTKTSHNTSLDDVIECNTVLFRGSVIDKIETRLKQLAV